MDSSLLHTGQLLLVSLSELKEKDNRVEYTVFLQTTSSRKKKRGNSCCINLEVRESGCENGKWYFNLNIKDCHGK